MKRRFPYCLLLIKKRQTKILLQTIGQLVYYLIFLKYLVRLLKIIQWKEWIIVFHLISQHIEHLTERRMCFWV